MGLVGGSRQGRIEGTTGDGGGGIGGGIVTVILGKRGTKNTQQRKKEHMENYRVALNVSLYPRFGMIPPLKMLRCPDCCYPFR